MRRVLAIPELLAQILFELDSCALIQCMSVSRFWHVSIIKNPRLISRLSSLDIKSGERFDLPNFQCSVETITEPYVQDESELVVFRERQQYNFIFKFGGAHADPTPRLGPRWQKMRVCQHLGPTLRGWRHLHFVNQMPCRNSLTGIETVTQCRVPLHLSRSRLQPGFSHIQSWEHGSALITVSAPMTFTSLCVIAQRFWDQHKSCLDDIRMLGLGADGRPVRDPIVAVDIISQTPWVDVLREEEQAV